MEPKMERKRESGQMGLSRLRVAIVGLGPIGIEVARAVAGRGDLELAAAIDVDPALRGKLLSELVREAPEGVKIDHDLAHIVGRDIDAIALCTSSRFEAALPVLEHAISQRVHVVSTCEEMAGPVVDTISWARVDERAKHAQVTLIGTGVNPGFVMDRLVLQLAGACVSVKNVRVERIVDAAKRRAPLRKKVGEGMAVEEWRALAAQKRLGHVGLRESAVLIARGLNWMMTRYEESLDPVTGADGRCLGLRQHAVGYVQDEPRITLHLEMYCGAQSPHDLIELDSDPPMRVLIEGGTQGDRGTIGTTVNALSRLRSAPRGLVTVADVFA
jgi:hypothetical protein